MHETGAVRPNYVRMFVERLLPRLGLAVALSSACVACTFLFNLSTTQCEVDSDCQKIGSALTCVAGSCGALDAGLDVAVDAAPECETNAGCIDANLGEPYICSKKTRKCVSVKAPNCAFVTPIEELRNDNAVLFGAFLPLKTSAPLTQPIALAYQLALSEIQKFGGLPGGLSSPRRPLVAVFCDSDPPVAEAGVKHLTKVLEVPAILSLFSQTDMTRFFQDYLGPSETFTLNPQDTTEALKGIDAKRLLWHLLGVPEEVALAYRPFIERLETYARSQGAPAPPATNIRLALVTSESPTEESMFNVLRSATPDNKGLRFNGKSTQDNGPASFLPLTVPSLETDPKATFGDVVGQLKTFEPNIVVLLTGSESGIIVPALDQALLSSGKPLPLYVLAPRNSRATTTYIDKPAAESLENRRKRFFGIQYAGAADKTQYDLFLQRFADRNPLVEQRTYLAVDNFYDAVYWLAYGLFAAGPGAPPTGPSFAEGVRKLLAGPPIHPGPVSEISKAFNSISTGGTTYMGALGAPDFDTASGAAHSVGAVYCYVKDAAGTAVNPRYDVLRYNRTSGQLDGTFDCFIPF